MEALQRALKGLPPKLELAAAFEVTRSLPHGHVAAVVGTARQLGVEELIDPVPSRRRDLVMALLVAQVLTPARSWPPRAGCAPKPPAAPWVRCWVSTPVMRMTWMRPWTGR